MFQEVIFWHFDFRLFPCFAEIRVLVSWERRSDLIQTYVSLKHPNQLFFHKLEKNLTQLCQASNLFRLLINAVYNERKRSFLMIIFKIELTALFLTWINYSKVFKRISLHASHLLNTVRRTSFLGSPIKYFCLPDGEFIICCIWDIISIKNHFRSKLI